MILLPFPVHRLICEAVGGFVFFAGDVDEGDVQEVPHAQIVDLDELRHESRLFNLILTRKLALDELAVHVDFHRKRLRLASEAPLEFFQREQYCRVLGEVVGRVAQELRELRDNRAIGFGNDGPGPCRAGITPCASVGVADYFFHTPVQ